MLKHEVLNAFCVVSEKHIDHILKSGRTGTIGGADIQDGITFRRCETMTIRRSWI
jgi:hypothetical protein